MKKFLTNGILILAAILLPQFVSSALACSCFPTPTPYRAFHEAKAVFVGKIISSKDVPFSVKGRNGNFTMHDRHYIFSVEESFKGANTSELEVNAGPANSSCFDPFEVGETYLVYAYGDSESTLRSGACTRTTTLAGASDDLYHIRALLKGVPEPRFYGLALKIDYDYAKSTFAIWKPLGGAKIIVEGEGRSFEAVADEQGRFSIAKLPDGKYKAWPELAKGRSNYPGELEFVLGALREDVYPSVQQGTSAYAQFIIGWSNQVSGKILDAEGNPLRHAKAAVMLTRPNDSPLVIREDADDSYKSDGKYQFHGLKPGRYILSLSIRAPFKKDKPKRFYYPNAVSLDEAGEIAIGESDSLTDRDIKLPPGYVLRRVEGALVWPDGSPVADGWVFLAESETSEDDDKKYDWDTTHGHFYLEGFEGAEYWVHGSVGTIGMKDSSGKDLFDRGIQKLKAKPVKVTVGKVNTPLRLVIQLPEGVEKPKK